ncbi:MAG: DUF6416 domain-containing protein [Actinomycetota bacterium]
MLVGVADHPGMEGAGDHSAEIEDPVVERATNAVLQLGAGTSPWTIADALRFVVRSEDGARPVAAEIAERVAADGGPTLDATWIVAAVAAAGVDFGAPGRQAARVVAVADVAPMLPDLDVDRHSLALDLLRRGGEACDLAVLLVPGTAPSSQRPTLDPAGTATDIVTAHLAGQLDVLAAALPRVTRRALRSSLAVADGAHVGSAEPSSVADPLWDDESLAEWLAAPAEDFEAVYRAALARPAVRDLLDVLVDHPGRRMSGDEICSLATDALRTPNGLPSAVNGLRAAVRSTGRSAPYRSWPGRPIRYGVHPAVAHGFLGARRRLLGIRATT